MGKKFWTPDKLDELRNLTDEGLSRKEISLIIGKSNKSINVICSKNGITCKHNQTKHVTSNCGYCKKSFTSLKNENKKFCDSSCSAKFNNKNRKRTPWTDAQKIKASKRLVGCEPENYKLKNCHVCDIEFATSLDSRLGCKSCGEPIVKRLSKPKKLKTSSSKAKRVKTSKVKVYKSYNCECDTCGFKFESETYKKYCKSCSTEYYSVYRPRAEFKFNPYDYPKWFELDLLDKYGFYSPSNKSNNLDGVSRDHRLSVRDGLDSKIDPYLLSHPANCELMIHRDNSKKYTGSSIDFKQLLVLIDMFEELYPEYDHCYGDLNSS